VVLAPAWLYDGIRGTHGSKNPVSLLGTFEKCSTLFKVKEDRNFNDRKTLSISRTIKRFTIC
jgi:hypothetical protein